MNVGTIILTDCVNQPPPPDARCQDPAFALANPTICPVAPFLLIKPGISLVCILGCMTFKAFFVKNGVETDVTSQAIFTSSDETIFTIGATSGTGTALTIGNVIVTATYQGLSSQAQLDVLGGSGSCSCCDNNQVAMMVMVDDTRSMSLQFAGLYSSRLAFAKAAANRFISEVNQNKDLVGLMQFDATANVVLAAPTNNKTLVQNLVNPIQQTQNKTTFYDALNTAINQLNATTAGIKVIVLISDGEDTTTSYLNFPNPIALLDGFKSNGGIVICVGCRASGEGFALLNKFATGGFFINGYPGTETATLNLLSGLKGYICAGNCAPTGDVIANQGQLNYSNFKNWNVVSGAVDLQGNCFFDYLPGNGLYVDLISGSQASTATNGKLVLKTSIPVVSGHTYRLAVDLAGNQLVSRPPDTAQIQVYYLNNDVNQTPIYLINQLVNITDYTQGFHTYPFTFSAPLNTNVFIAIQQQDIPTILTASGLLLNRVKFDDVTNITNLLDDNFDTENPVYVPPRCGIGTTYVYLGTSQQVFTPFVFVNQENDFLGQFPITIPTAITNQQYRLNLTFTSQSCLLEPNNASQLKPVLTYTDWNGVVQTVNFSQVIQVNNCTPVSIPTQTFNAKANTVITISFVQVPGFIVNPDRQFLEVGELDIITSKPGYGYAYGYCCYGTGCLTSPPPSQLADPIALPDIESGSTTGPTTFTSTKQACATCPSGTVNAPSPNLIPVMTSNTAPSGIASASSNNGTAFQAFDGITTFNNNDLTSGWRSVVGGIPATLQYQFASAQVADHYTITAWKGNYSAPQNWKLQGSNDGSTWTDLDTQTGLNFFSGETKSFQFNNTTAYLYYRLNVSATIPPASNPNILVILEFTLSKSSAQQVCMSATATSQVSQADADNQAYAAALALAQAALNCVTQYSSTEQFTATCPVGTFGTPSTQSATATSLVSQAEANAAALALATAAAQAALNCTLSNNDRNITINDVSVTGQVAAATPFPSVKYVTGAPASISKVMVTLKGLSHTAPGDILCMLLHQPTGKTCYLLARAGGKTVAANNITLIFDDAAATQTPQAGPMVGGTFQCSAYLPAASLPSPAPQQPYGVNLATFIGINGNGSWALWVGDAIALDSGNIALGWDLTIT